MIWIKLLQLKCIAMTSMLKKKDFKKLNILKSITYFEKVESFPSCAEKAEKFDIWMVPAAGIRLKELNKDIKCK